MQNLAYEDKYLIDLFKDVSMHSKVFDDLKHLKVLNINAYKKSRRFELFLASNRIVSACQILELEKNLASHFTLSEVKIKIRFDTGKALEQLLDEYFKDIIFLINKKVASSVGLLSNSQWELSNEKLIIKLKTQGSSILKARNCHCLIEEMIADFFDFKVRVAFKDCKIDKEVREIYLEERSREEAKIIGSTITDISVPRVVQKPEVKAPKFVKPKKNAQPCDILGRVFDDGLVSVSEINQESGTIAIKGEIFRVETRDIRNEKVLVIFDMTDYTDSVTIKFFAKKEDMEPISQKIKEGLWVKVKGDAQYDKFSREVCVFASDIMSAKGEQDRVDSAIEKRVELHLHTQMSSLDAVSSASELIKRAAKWGHKAIAVTDHGVVQAYPEAYEAAKKNNIKLICGIECYLVNDDIPIVCGSKAHKIDGDFVVVDIETTGLSSAKDKITEIGAVKIRNNEIIDTFSSLVNPEVPIPSFITKLTGITDQMVKDAPKIDKVLDDFLKFVDDSAIVAHNAQFDLGFIKYNATKTGITIENPILDTLELSRKMFPTLGKYKLNIVAKHLGVDLENHHRAVDDSTATAKIFIKIVESLKEKGVTTIDEIDSAFEKGVSYKQKDTFHAVILVKNMQGLKNLYKIVSQSHLKYFHKRPRVPKSLFEEHREGLILGTACEAGELFCAILENKNEADIEKIANFYDYFEIQPLGNNNFLIEKEKVKNKQDLIDINKKIIKLGDKQKKLVVATCDVHFMDPRDEVFRRILMAGKGFDDADNQAPLYLRTTDEMLKEFDYLDKTTAYDVVVKNTNLIADMIEDVLPIPDGTFPPKIDGAEDEIKELATTKAKEIYGENLPEIVEKRLKKELSSIINNGFSVMYIIAMRLVLKSLKDGYLVGSRGSVGSSFVAYLTGITEVNSLPAHYVCEGCKYSEFILDGSVGCGFDLPQKTCPNCSNLLKKDGYDIPFETFLGFDGDKEPDIDLNFSGEYQPVAHKYTEELFGKGQVFRAGTIATIAEKTAYGFVKNYFEERGRVLNNAETNRLIKGCSGVKRTTGQHPGGVMIVPSDREIYEFCPIQRPADDTNSDIITTHFDYHSISGRLLKLDILGHDDPTVIKMLEDLTGVDARSIPIGEERTMGIFSSTEALKIKPEDINSEVGTFAIPEFGTKFVRQMLVDTKPKTFAELIKISGLSHGTDVWLNNAQDLIKSNQATLKEVICTRDDIMLYLISAKLPPKQAFKIMENVRKGKGLRKEDEELMQENDVPDWYIDSCNKIKYMFPKAHAAAYVMMAFRIAYFKIYYPEAFYVTYFTVRADDFDAGMMTQERELIRKTIKDYEKKGNELTQKEKNVLTILEVVNEMYARGIKFLPIDLYQSDAVKFEVLPSGIRPPLNSMQGLGIQAAQGIVEARKQGRFISIEDLRLRSKVSKTVIDILRQGGCLDGMPESSQVSFF